MRSIEKIKSKLIYLSLKFRLLGARGVGISANRNIILKLNRKTVLGDRGTLLQIPEDRVIYKTIKTYAVWEEDVSTFLASILRCNLQSSNKYPPQRMLITIRWYFLILGQMWV